jgi:dTDP-glucose 4,6-dehydratase
LAPLLDLSSFTFVESDVSESLDIRGDVDAVAHLASPASPPDYHALPIETLAVGSRGTEHALRLADRSGARFILASTSEIYGDPLVHPQSEDYYGNVNSIGPRSVYDEAKRFAEALTMAYRRTRAVDAGIIRIFNTYGPRMRCRDGRVVSTFITQALNGQPLTIYGDGTQTRSFCFVSDLVEGIASMIDSTDAGPINLGNPSERSVLQLAEMVIHLTSSDASIEYHTLPKDDPTRRKPDISRARSRLGWTPRVSVDDGLRQTVDWFRGRPDELTAAAKSLAGAQFEGVDESATQDAA